MLDEDGKVDVLSRMPSGPCATQPCPRIFLLGHQMIPIGIAGISVIESPSFAELEESLCLTMPI